ncbi:MAG: heavy-metal-associated domain-containing protein [Cryobacterium sp.]|nr:heavy-metal-associated domain-containing protein [Micrococcales bacterium]MBX3308959.1 heavy-metal-associated domain-containing protein [Cryobacterium sp.]
MCTSTFTVRGPNCGVCLGELLERVREIKGVNTVTADLSPGGSAVMVVGSTTELSIETMRAAIQQAGFASITAGSGPRPRGGAKRLLAARELPRLQNNDELWIGGARS